MTAGRPGGSGGTAHGGVPHPRDLTRDQRRRFLKQLERDLGYRVLAPNEAEGFERHRRRRVGRLALRGVLARLPEVLLRHARDGTLQAAVHGTAPLGPAEQAVLRRRYVELVAEVDAAAARLGYLDVDDLDEAGLELPGVDDVVEGAPVPYGEDDAADG